MVSREKITPLRHDYKRRRRDREVIVNTAFEEKVSIVYYYPNMKPDIIDSLIDNGYRGIIIAGTGLGPREQAPLPGAQARHGRRTSPST